MTFQGRDLVPLADVVDADAVVGRGGEELTVRAAIVNGGGATDFCARFLDEESRPIKGLTVSLASR